MKSYVAVVRADSGHILLGGVRKTRSSRLETEEMADTLGQINVGINEEADRPCSYWVETVDGRPEIMADEIA